MGQLLTLAADTGSARDPGRDVPEGYAFRRCESTDIEPLGRLYFASYEPGVGAATAEEGVREMRATFDGEYGELWTEASLIALHRGELVAAVQTVRRAPWDDTPDGPFVIELFTAPDHRRQGLARILLTTAMSVAAEAGHGRIALRVDPDNDSARTLYDRLGFRRWPDGSSGEV